MDSFLIFKKPLLDVHAVPAGYRKIIEGYKFISILTDGGINPSNNVAESAVCQDNDTDCYIEFDNGERIWINQEIRNYGIPIRAHYFDYYNRIKSASLCLSKDTEAGYNNLFFILSREKINLQIHKRPPIAIFNYEIPASGSKDYWFGKNKDSATSELLIPWIPEQYKRVRYMVGSDSPADITATFFQYMGEGTIVYNSFALTPAGYTTPFWGETDNFSSYRFKYGLANGDAVNPHYVRAAFVWTDN